MILVFPDRPADLPSLASLKAQHKELLERYRREQKSIQFQDNIVAFIDKGRATGMLLDSSNDRWATQSLLDHWSNELYRLRHQVHSAVLDKFNPDIVSEYVSHANEFYEQLASSERGRVRRIVLCLVQLDGDSVTCNSMGPAKVRHRMGGSPIDTD